MRTQTCCFTGHRTILGHDKQFLEEQLEQAITSLIGRGVWMFLAGGALGFDTMAALAVLKLKREYPHIRLQLVLPCKDQSKGWSTIHKNNYEDILQQADSVLYISDEYRHGCMQMRNRYLVDNSAYCICYQINTTGGTAYTVEYAKQNSLQILNLAE